MARPDKTDISDLLLARQKELEAERDAILSDPLLVELHAQRDALIAQIQPIENELREVQAKIKGIEQPRLRDVGNAIADCARARGARSLRNG